MNLQAKMVEHITSPGNISFNEYRAFRTETREETEPMRFVDGELIERFLDCSLEEQQACIEGLIDNDRQVTVEQIQDLVENLKRLH